MNAGKWSVPGLIAAALLLTPCVQAQLPPDAPKLKRPIDSIPQPTPTWQQAPVFKSGVAVGSPIEARVTWTDSTGAPGYDILRNGAVIAVVGTAERAYVDATLRPNTAYVYQVQARTSPPPDPNAPQSLARMRNLDERPAEFIGLGPRILFRPVLGRRDKHDHGGIRKDWRNIAHRFDSRTSAASICVLTTARRRRIESKRTACAEMKARAECSQRAMRARVARTKIFQHALRAGAVFWNDLSQDFVTISCNACVVTRLVSIGAFHTARNKTHR